MTISLRLSDADSKLIKAYASMHGLTVSELCRKSVMERIEDELDLRACEEAIEEYHKNPVTISHEDVAKLLDLE